jgi:GMP synthase (glutamine-hydrolysing)
MIVVIDFGSQTTHLIKRRISNFGIETQIVEPEKFSASDYPDLAGLIFSGGPASVYAADSPDINKAVLSLGLPILGICYGWQLIAKKLGGDVIRGEKEYGPARLSLNQNSPLFANLPQTEFQVWMSHGDLVKKLPSNFTYLGQTADVKAAAVADLDKNIYGVQFHPEVQHTEFGLDILQNFVTQICGLKIKEKKLDVAKVIKQVKKQLAGTKGKIVAAVSGGVDSSVAAAIVGKAAPDRLVPIYCDNGLMRLGTKEQVEQIFAQHLGVEPKIINCQDEFLKALKGVSAPEKKRKIIGNLYIEIFEREAKKLDNVEFLVQGTIYSDVIESKGSKHASKIKSHHNVGGLPEKMNLKLIEPLREFYKDEVRELGKQLNLPEDVVKRQPFPGPGHAIRIIGEVTAKRLQKQQQADQIVIEDLKETGWYDKLFQSFPIMTGVDTTAVKGDERAYAELVGLRIYDSKDIMTAGWSRLPYEVLQQISSRIVNEVPDVSRVAYDITTKPPATMEWE